MPTIVGNAVVAFIATILLALDWWQPRSGYFVHAVRQINIDGDIILGGLFPIHEGGRNSEKCGRIKADQGVQRMVGMLYALRIINDNKNLLPGIKLGAQILDTCSVETHALEQSLEFIKTVMSTSDGLTCSDGSRATYKRQPVAAVVGAASSQVSVMVASMLQLFEIPMISYSSTGAELSEKPRFEYFSRVVPPDNLQAKAMAHLVAQLNWTYVHAIADTGSYGERGMDSFRAAATELGICIDGDIHKVSLKWSDEQFKELILRLRQTNKARGVVMFVDEDNLKRFLFNLKQLIHKEHHLELKGYFWFVASDSWGKKAAVIKTVESVVAGTITVAPKTKTLVGFDDFLLDQGPSNTFLTEYWESMDCSNRINIKFRGCFESINYTFRQEAYVPYVYDAVATLAHALHNYIATYCDGKAWKDCSLSKEGFKGDLLQKFYRNVSVLPNQPPLIDENGDGIGHYSIFQLDDKGSYHEVGRWLDGGELILNNTYVQDGLKATTGSTDNPVSVCSLPCERGFYRAYQDQTCCWTCIPCDVMTSIIINETICKPCELGYVPNSKLDACQRINPVHLKWTSAWALVPAIFSVCGIVATIFVVSVFVRYNDTPVVMASGRELCYCMLFGIGLCYFVTIFLVSTPSPLICSLQRFFIGLSMSAVYAAILVKTNRLARVFKANSPVRPKWISPPAQVFFCSGIVTIQVTVILFFLLFDPPATDINFPTRVEAVLTCKNATFHLFISLGYNLLLICLCTVYAVKTRKIPENFNETRLIGFTMYSTCILWTSFTPIYFATQNNFKIQITSLCMCISMSGTVALACFFAPKVYIVLFQPYKNVRTRHSAVGKLVNQQMRFISQLTTPQPFVPTDVSTNCTGVSLMDVKSSTLAASSEGICQAAPSSQQRASADLLREQVESSATTTTAVHVSVQASEAESTAQLSQLQPKTTPPQRCTQATQASLIMPSVPITKSQVMTIADRRNGVRVRALSLTTHPTDTQYSNNNNNNNNNNPSNHSCHQSSSGEATSSTASISRPTFKQTMDSQPPTSALGSRAIDATIDEEDRNNEPFNDSNESLIRYEPVQMILQEINADSFATFL